jgi:hypothetical protein
VRGSLLTALLVGALAGEIAAHVALIAGLVARRPRWRGLLAILIPPLAPYWGWSAGMHRRVYAWCAALALYALGVILAA